jgi:hypothetical protein
MYTLSGFNLPLKGIQNLAMQYRLQQQQQQLFSV